MYPVLVVEGVAHKVRTVEFSSEGTVEGVSYFNEGKCRYVYDVKARLGLTSSEVMDLTKAIQWHGRYDELHREIEKEIECRESRMVALAIENMHNQQPFTPSDIPKKYFDLLNQQVGLMDAQEVIENFMEEDVDLSGGDEV